MILRITCKPSITLIFAFLLIVGAAGQSFAQGQGGQGNGQGNGQRGNGQGAKKDQKKIDKDANKLADKADQASSELGRDVVFCILAAHTTGVGTAEELRAQFTGLTDVAFGQFVAAVIMADRIDKPLQDILDLLEEGRSLGQIAKQLDVDVSELRKGFGEFRSELARSMTNPPTRNCFQTTD
jgi:hypothetical protein